MRFNQVNLLVASIISALLAYALWSLSVNIKNYIAIGSLVFFFSTLMPLFMSPNEKARNLINLKVVAGVFFVISLVLNIVFMLLDISATAYVITSGLIFMLYALLAYNIYSASQ